MNKRTFLDWLTVIAITLIAVAIYAAAFFFAVNAYGHLTTILWTEEIPIME